MVRPWTTSWQRSTETWVDYPNSLHIATKTFNNIIDEIPMLQEYAQKASRLNELPWMEIARKIADGVNRTDERLDSAEGVMSVKEIRDYVNDWRTASPTVNKLIGWSFFG